MFFASTHKNCTARPGAKLKEVCRGLTMLKRKLQYNNNIKSYFLVVPKQLAEALNLQKGDMIGFEVVNNRITLTAQR